MTLTPVRSTEVVLTHNVYEFATDTFVVRDGKIAVQTFAGKVTPRR